MKSYFHTLTEYSLKRVFLSPVLPLYSSFFLASVFLLSRISLYFSFLDASYFSVNLHFAIFTILFILLASFFLSGIIFLSLPENPLSLKKAFHASSKFLLRNFILILIVSFLSVAVFYFSLYFSFFVGKLLSLSEAPAVLLNFLVYFGLLAGFESFFALSSFILIKKNLSITNSIKSSFKLVSSNYISVFSVLVLFFIIFSLNTRFFNSTISSIIEYIILIPLLSSVLSKLISK